MRKQIIALLSLAVIAGCSHTTERSKFDVWLPPQEKQAIQPKAGAHAGTEITINAPQVIEQRPPEQIMVSLTGDVAAKARSVCLSAAPGHLPNKRNWQITSPLKEVRQRDGVPFATVNVSLSDLRPGAWPLGFCVLKAEALDESGKPLGSAQQQVICIGDSVDRYILNVQNARVGELAAHEPYKAAQWCAVAAAVDRLKQAADHGTAADVSWRLLEADARVDLAMGKLYPKVARQYLHDLLILQGAPEAEVAVEFQDSHHASVTYNWGAIPLGNVNVTQFDSAAAANQAVKSAFLGVPAQATNLFRGNENLEANTFLLSEPVTSQEVNLYQEAFLWFPQQNQLNAVSVDKLGLLSYEAVVRLPGMHSDPATALAMLQDQRRVTEMPVAQAARLNSVLVVGDPASDKLLASAKLARITPRKGATVMVVANGNRVFRGTAPDEASCYSMVLYTMGTGPVSASQVDTLRKRILKAIAPDIKPDNSKPRIAASMYCGDLHMHTFYSDGNCSPAALVFEAIYSQQDFSVITDHNTIAGALWARDAFAKAGIRYNLIVGEEFTSDYHANIFPVTQAFVPPMDPQELTRLMHQQGIYVQWNHPGYPVPFGHQYIVNGMGDLGFDAWEHLPQRYDQWRTEGKLPLITGTTDTHDGTFGASAERTVIFSAKADGQSLADALRAGQAVAVIPEAGTLFVGEPARVKLALSALANGGALRDAHAQRLRDSLINSRPAEVLKASPTAAAGSVGH